MRAPCGVGCWEGAAGTCLGGPLFPPSSGRLIFLQIFAFGLLFHAWLCLLAYSPPDFLLSAHCFLFPLFLSAASSLWEAL